MRSVSQTGADQTGRDLRRTRPSIEAIAVFWVIAGVGCWLLFVALAGPKRTAPPLRTKSPASPALWAPATNSRPRTPSQTP
jgi:hypothetical protein